MEHKISISVYLRRSPDTGHEIILLLPDQLLFQFRHDRDFPDAAFCFRCADMEFHFAVYPRIVHGVADADNIPLQVNVFPCDPRHLSEPCPGTQKESEHTLTTARKRTKRRMRAGSRNC